VHFNKKKRADGSFFTDCYSRADLPTVAVLRAVATGQVLLRLEAADLAPLLATGWTLPQPFVTTAPDGVTPLHSLLWAPHGLGDNNTPIPDGSVPVLENIYTGPHSAHVPKRFSAVACTQTAAAAALGFAVVFIDGRGTGLRSRAFRELSHKNLGDGSGGPDHPHVIRAMAKQNTYMDLDNVGIWVRLLE